MWLKLNIFSGEWDLWEVFHGSPARKGGFPGFPNTPVSVFMANNGNDHNFFNNSQPLHSYQCVLIATTSIIRSLLFPKQEMWRLKPWLWLVSSRRNKSCVWFFWQFKIFSEILKNHEIWFLLTMKNIFAGAVNVGSVLINGMALTS